MRNPLISCMTNIFAKSFLALCLSASSITIGTAQDTNLPTKELLASLSDGGYVLYMRHASTEKDYADQVTAEIGNCATQRTLSEAGWDEAALIGASFETAKIPVGALYSSEYCRAWKTARIAFGIPVKLADLNFQPAEDYTDAQIAAMRNAVMPLLSKLPANGTNTIIVGHDDPFEAATGVYPEPQGVIYVVKPEEGDAFEIVGSVKPTEWLSLLAEKAASDE